MTIHPKHNRVLRVIVCSLLGIAAFIIVAVTAISLWLTPNRLTRLANENIAKFIDADVNIGNIRYSLWKSFPHLRFSVDSVSVYSRSLGDIPDSLASHLPADADFLASVVNIEGSLNLWKAIHSDIAIDSLSVRQPEVNIVIINDSVNNFSILPDKLGKSPDISFSAEGPIQIEYPAKIAFTDLSRDIRINADINSASVAPSADARDSYRLSLESSIAGNVGTIALPKPLPLSLNGDIKINLAESAIDLNRCGINAGNISSFIDLSFQAGEKPLINSLVADISTTDAMETLSYLPSGLSASFSKVMPVISSLNLHIPLQIQVALDAPFHVGGSELPAFSTSLKIPDAELSVPLPFGAPLKVNNIDLDANLKINPADSNLNRLDISRFSLLTDGLKLDLTGNMRELLSDDPIIEADLIFDADLRKLQNEIIPGNSTSFNGDLKSNLSLNCRLSGISGLSLSNMNSSLQKINLDGELQTTLLSIKDVGSGLFALISNLDLKIDAGASQNSSGAHGDVDMKVGSLSFSQAKNKVVLSNIGLTLDARLREIPFTPATFSSPSDPGSGDAVIGSKVAHTPLILSPSLPGIMQTIMSMADIKGDLSVGSGNMFFKSYPSQNSFSGLSIATDLDTLSLRGKRFDVAGMQGDIKANVGNLRSFLATSPALLSIDGDINLTTVDINRLAGLYYAGITPKGKSPDFSVPTDSVMTAADSLCVAIPRNLQARFRMHADSARYMQFTLAPLSTVLSMKGGDARIGNLQIGAPYAGVKLDWTYRTSDLADISMDIDLQLKDFNFDNFVRAMPALAGGNPNLSALSGSIDMMLDTHFLMFPDMFINAPSITADFNIKGRNLSISRDGNHALMKYTHLMMMKGDGKIAIDGLDINGRLRNNLLTVAPFRLSAGPYQLLIGGANNMAGEMYYHAGLLKSPLHLPLGININGNFRHPSFRISGDAINSRREREISQNLDDNIKVNIMKQLRQGWLQFIATAAKYDYENNRKGDNSVE